MPVQVWGTDAQGKPFMQSAHTANVSEQGVVLEGIAVPVRAGEIVRVQCGDQKANFQVVRAGEPGTEKGGQVALKALVPGRWIWAMPVPVAKQDSYVLPRAAERRSERRRGSALKVELREDGSPAPLWGTTEDISLGGCFVTMDAPLKPGAALEIIVWIGGEKIWSRAVVRTSEPGSGFGVEFTYMPDRDVRILKSYLESLPGIRKAREEETPSP
jgi:hypothetical protein